MGQWTVLLIFVTLLVQGTPHGESMDGSSNDKSHKLSTNINTSNGHVDTSGSQPEGRANNAVKSIGRDSQANLELKNRNNVANIKSNLAATRKETNAIAVGAIENQQLGELRAQNVLSTSIQEQAPMVEGQPINVIPSVQDTSSTECSVLCSPSWLQMLKHAIGILPANHGICKIGKYTSCGTAETICATEPATIVCCPMTCLDAIAACYQGPPADNMCVPTTVTHWMPQVSKLRQNLAADRSPTTLK